MSQTSPVTERDDALVRDLALAFAAGRYEGGETLFDMYANIALKFMETRGLAQTPAVRLEARPADDSQPWTEIFPVQLQWIAKQGHQVRAIELADTSTARGHELVTFLAIWAVQYAKDHELDGLHPTHFDLMVKYGARMNDFKRATNAASSPDIETTNET
jgi:hypothetical protein